MPAIELAREFVPPAIVAGQRLRSSAQWPWLKGQSQPHYLDRGASDQYRNRAQDPCDRNRLAQQTRTCSDPAGWEDRRAQQRSVDEQPHRHRRSKQNKLEIHCRPTDEDLLPCRALPRETREPQQLVDGERTIENTTESCQLEQNCLERCRQEGLTKRSRRCELQSVFAVFAGSDSNRSL